MGSANLNRRGLALDTEMNVQAVAPDVVHELRVRLWSEHLEKAERDVSGDSTRVIDELWRPISEEQRNRRERGEPQTHRLSEIPNLSRRTRRLLGPVQGLLVDG